MGLGRARLSCLTMPIFMANFNRQSLFGKDWVRGWPKNGTSSAPVDVVGIKLGRNGDMLAGLLRAAVWRENVMAELEKLGRLGTMGLDEAPIGELCGLGLCSLSFLAFCWFLRSLICSAISLRRFSTRAH